MMTQIDSFGLQPGCAMTQTKNSDTLTPPQSPEAPARIQAKGRHDYITPDAKPGRAPWSR